MEGGVERNRNMEMKIGIITMEKVSNRPINSVGSSRIRGRWIAKYWKEAEEYQIGKKYDILIFQKAWWDWMIEEFNGIKIFDICDPDWLDARRPYFGLMSKCDAIVTNTRTMADYLKKLIKHISIVCIPDRVDLEEHQNVKKKHKGKLQNCVWFGYSHNFHFVERTLDKLNKERINLTIISDKSLVLNPMYSDIKLRNIEYSYPQVHDEIIKHDAVLVPTTDFDIRGRFKSNNKVLTAWALRMPVIREPKDIDRFMTAEAREKEADKRRKEVEEKWDVRLSVKEYKELINEIQSRKK